MENNLNTDIVVDEEKVLRYLKRRYYDAIQKQWSTDAFELRSGEQSISVCRQKLLGSIEEGAKRSFPEKMWKSIIAYTSIEVGDIRDQSTEIMKVDVVPEATENNPSHAGIIASVANKTIIGIPTNPAYYNLQGKLLELSLPNVTVLNLA